MKRTILVIGALPPPYHGGSVVAQTLLESPLADRYNLLHLDITDDRGVENIGRLDTGNVWLAAVHGCRFLMMLRRRPDVVYMPVAQNTLGFLRDALFMVPAAVVGTPLVLHFHSGSYARFVNSAPAPLRWLVRALLGRAHSAIVLGSALIPMLHGLVARDRIAVVPNCVPDRPIERAPARQDAPVRLLFLGNLIRGKGYAELMRAVEMLTAEGLDVELILAGGGMNERARKETLAGCAVPERIRFTGPVGVVEKCALLGEADAVVLPSYYENEAHPLVLLEAMAAGLPVVSTRYVAIPEIVTDGVTGLLVEPRDVTALAAALRRLVQDAQLRRRMGAAAREHYLARFTVPLWVERMAAVFDDAVSARGS